MVPSETLHRVMTSKKLTWTFCYKKSKIMLRNVRHSGEVGSDSNIVVDFRAHMGGEGGPCLDHYVVGVRFPGLGMTSRILIPKNEYGGGE